MSEYVTKLTKINTFKDIKPNTEIKDITPGKKLINIIVIVIEKIKTFKLKNEQQIYSFLVADQTGSIQCNFYDDIGQSIKEGDVIYIHSGYGSILKNFLALYTPKLDHGNIVKINEFFFLFNEKPNFSDVCWKKVNETYEIDLDDNKISLA